VDGYGAAAGNHGRCLVNTHAAAALQFGIERDFSKKEQTVSKHLCFKQLKD
jgi:hypothetical protein